MYTGYCRELSGAGAQTATVTQQKLKSEFLHMYYHYCNTV